MECLALGFPYLISAFIASSLMRIKRSIFCYNRSQNFCAVPGGKDMKFLSKGIGGIICVIVALMSVALFGTSVNGSNGVSLDPYHQFLEIRNITWAVHAYVYLVDQDSDHNKLLEPGNRAQWIAQRDPVYAVTINQSIRLTGALKPGRWSILVVSSGTDLASGATKSLLTNKFEVSDYGAESFLFGLYLTLNPNIRNGHKVESVRFLHGDWLLQYPAGKDGKTGQVKMKLQHLSRRPDFSGEILNYEGHVQVRGETNGRSMTFTHLQGQMPAMTWKLRVDNRGNWVGKNIMDMGEGPLAFNVDYLRKILHVTEW